MNYFEVLWHKAKFNKYGEITTFDPIKKFETGL